MKFFFLDLTMMTKDDFKDCKNPLERYMFIIKNSEHMKEKPEGYPEFDELFEALDTTAMACEDVVEYNKSRLKMLDDERDMKIYGRQQWEDGMEKGIKKGMEKGMEKGIIEGKLAKAIAIAKNLLGMKIAPAQVATVCGLDLSQVQLLAKEL